MWMLVLVSLCLPSIGFTWLLCVNAVLLVPTSGRAKMCETILCLSTLPDLQAAWGGTGELHTCGMPHSSCLDFLKKNSFAWLTAVAASLATKCLFLRVDPSMTRVTQGLGSASWGRWRVWCLHHVSSCTASPGLFQEAHPHSSTCCRRSWGRPAFMLDKRMGGSPWWAKYIYERNRLQILQWSLGHELS